MKIGFIGLGNVGGKLAGSLLKNKFDLTVRDLEKNLTNDFKKLLRELSSTPGLTPRLSLLISELGFSDL